MYDAIWRVLTKKFGPRGCGFSSRLTSDHVKSPPWVGVSHDWCIRFSWIKNAFWEYGHAIPIQCEIQLVLVHQWAHCSLEVRGSNYKHPVYRLVDFFIGFTCYSVIGLIWEVFKDREMNVFTVSNHTETCWLSRSELLGLFLGAFALRLWINVNDSICFCKRLAKLPFKSSCTFSVH